jgi:hypothetical protein
LIDKVLNSFFFLGIPKCSIPENLFFQPCGNDECQNDIDDINNESLSSTRAYFLLREPPEINQ